jgi:hypothetical protein
VERSRGKLDDEDASSRLLRLFKLTDLLYGDADCHALLGSSAALMQRTSGASLAVCRWLLHRAHPL